MKQEHIDAIRAAIFALDPDHNPGGIVRMGVIREAFEAIFEHLCEHEENLVIAHGQTEAVIAERIIEQSPPGLDRRSTTQRNIEP